MPRHIAVVVHALHGGGAERVAAAMANLWAGRGDRVTAITLAAADTDVYQVDSSVRRVGLALMGKSRNNLEAIWNNRRRVRALRTAIRDAQADCIVSVTDQMNILTLLASRGLQVPVVIAEHSDPRHQGLGLIRERLRRRLYPQAAAIVVLTQSVADHLCAILGERPIHVIPNGIERPPESALRARADVQPLIVSMGRLSNEKQFGKLISAFAQLATRYPDWRLAIAGEGPQRDALQRQIQDHGLARRVELVGWVDDPFAFLSRGAIYVLSSRYEGFPVALLEAMAMGLAVVSVDCDSGPREIIQDGVNGRLVPVGDLAVLTQSIAQLIEDQQLRNRLGSAARTVVERFSPERFEERWDRVFGDIL